MTDETKQRIEKEAGRLAHTFTKEHTTNLAMKQMFEQVITAEYNRAQEQFQKQRELLDEMAEVFKKETRFPPTSTTGGGGFYEKCLELLAKYSQLKSEKE